MANELPPNRRYIATHDAEGKSVYAESPEQVWTRGSDTIRMARSWSIASVPAKLADDVDMKAYFAGPESVTSSQRPEIVVPPEDGNNNGANLLVVDLEPGGFSGMHRTVSIDFSICVIGTIIHELDGGEQVTLHPGDHIVQRGTNHRWRNASTTEPARFLAVTLPCEPFEIAGKLLKEVHLPDNPAESPKL